MRPSAGRVARPLAFTLALLVGGAVGPLLSALAQDRPWGDPGEPAADARGAEEDVDALREIAEVDEEDDDALPDAPETAQVVPGAPCSPSELGAIQTLFPRMVQAATTLDMDGYFRLLAQLIGSLGPRCQAALAASAGGGGGGGGTGGPLCSGGHCCDNTGCY